MSGRKYSGVELANAVKEAIGCRRGAEEALCRAESLTVTVRDAARTVAALAPVAEASERALADIREQLGTINRDFVQEKMMRLDLDEVRKRKRMVESLRQELERLALRCRSTESVVGIRAEIAAIRSHLERDRTDLEAWLPDLYKDYLDRTNGLLDSLDREVRATGSVAVVAPSVPDHAAEFEALRARAAERRDRDGERMYIAGALRRVCAEMGFAAKELDRRSVVDDLVIEVDTFAYGLLHFRLQLDGTIRSQSELSETTCCANFGAIEDKLRDLGVISAFRYEGDQTPVRLEKGAKEIPGGDSHGVSASAKS